MANSWIKMPLGIRIGRPRSSHIVTDGNHSPESGAAAPHFSACVYCGQTAGWINMPLGTEAYLSLSHIVRWGPGPQYSTAPPFSAHVRCGQRTGWTKMPLSAEVCLGSGDIVLDGDAAYPTETYTQHPAFRSMSIVAKQLAG